MQTASVLSCEGLMMSLVSSISKQQKPPHGEEVRRAAAGASNRSPGTEGSEELRAVLCVYVCIYM